MKTTSYLIIGILLLTFQSLSAQKSTAPVEDQPVETILAKDPVTQCAYRYHYYPNLGGYYDAKTNLYILKQNGVWTTVKEIPSGYMGYSLNNRVNVVITDYDEDDITQFINAHRKKYPYNFHQKLREVTSTGR